MKEGIVLCIGDEQKWWWGDECSVPSFELAFMEIHEMFQRIPNGRPVFFHSHPNGFPMMSAIDKKTIEGLLFALRRSFLFLVITEKTITTYSCQSSGEIEVWDAPLFIIKAIGERMITELREKSYGSE